jgi:molybdate transport system regulatory protein
MSEKQEGSNSGLQGEIWLGDESSSKLMLSQIGLLQAIVETGSISAAAKQAGISYKTAWERLEKLNNLSPSPILARSAGGFHGGGTTLTEYGEKILNGFSELQSQHERFIEGLGGNIHSIDDLSRFIMSTRVNSSARNQFLGTITEINSGVVNTEVSMELEDGLPIVATVTGQSCEDMDLQPGKAVIALVKASAITLSIGKAAPLVSARNLLAGTVSRIHQGPVNTELAVSVGEHKTLSVVITSKSIERLGLVEGSRVCAFFKASSVILIQP